MLLDRSWCFLFPFGCLLYKLGFIPHEQDCSDNMGYVFPDTSLVNKIDVCFLLTDASQLAKYHDSQRCQVQELLVWTCTAFCCHC